MIFKINNSTYKKMTNLLPLHDNAYERYKKAENAKHSPLFCNEILGCFAIYEIQNIGSSCSYIITTETIKILYNLNGLIFWIHKYIDQCSNNLEPHSLTYNFSCFLLRYDLHYL